MIVSLESVREAARGLEGVAVRTPLIAAPALARLAGESVALKGEHLQPVGAFKIRGAFTAISRLSAADRAAGVITYSSGNHGQAVAYAAARLGTRAIVVMPDHAPAIKVEGVKRHGGEVHMGGPTSATRREKAETIAQSEGLTIIPPFDDPNVIAGQATCSLEILEQAPDVETLIVPVGGGGLLAGACIVVAALKPRWPPPPRNRQPHLPHHSARRAGDGPGQRHGDHRSRPVSLPRMRCSGGALRRCDDGRAPDGRRATQWSDGCNRERRERGPHPLPAIGTRMSLAPKILVADDDETLNRTLSWVLKDNGYEVETVAGGKNLVERLLAQSYDLLLLDILVSRPILISRISPYS